MMNKFLTNNSATYRLLRTVAQVLVGFIIDNAVMLVAQTTFSPEVQTVIVSGTILVLTPIMQKLGRYDEKARDQNA